MILPDNDNDDDEDIEIDMNFNCSLTEKFSSLDVIWKETLTFTNSTILGCRNA